MSLRNSLRRQRNFEQAYALNLSVGSPERVKCDAAGFEGADKIRFRAALPQEQREAFSKFMILGPHPGGQTNSNATYFNFYRGGLGSVLGETVGARCPGDIRQLEGGRLPRYPAVPHGYKIISDGQSSLRVSIQIVFI